MGPACCENNKVDLTSFKPERPTRALSTKFVERGLVHLSNRKEYMKNPKAIILCDSIENITRVFGLGRLQRLKKLAKVHPVIITGKSFDHAIACASEAKYIFSTWGMPVLEQKQIDDMKKLKAVFYAAGSVKYFAAPYLKKGIKVISAWAGNAKPLRPVWQNFQNCRRRREESLTCF